MPVVPLAKQEVAPSPLAQKRAFTDNFAGANTNVSADTYGAIQGRQLQDVGSAVQRAGDPLAVAAQRMQERQDDEQTRRAYLDFDRQTRELLYGEAGIYNRRGANAQGASVDAFKKLGEFEKKVSSGLATPRQRGMFEQRVGGIKAGHLDSIARHESNEFRTVEEETTKAVLQSSIEGATGAYANPNLRERYRMQGELEMENLAQKHGWVPELLDLKKIEYTTGLHKAVIERMLVNDPTGARAYYQANQAEINGGTQTGLEGALKEGATREAAYGEVSRILSTTTGYSAQLAEARAIPDKTLADNVVARVKERHAEDQQALAAGERAAKDTAWKIVMQTGKLDAVPAHVISQLDGYTVNAMQGFLDKRGQIDTDPGTYAELSRLSIDDKKAFAALNMQDYVTKLAPTEWKQVQGWQRSAAAALAGDAKATSAATKEATVQQQITAALDSSGVIGTSDKVKQQRGLFMQKARSELDQAEAAKGRPLTIDEVDQHLGRLLLQGNREKLGPDASARAFEVLGTPQEAKFYVPYDDVPEADRQAITQKLQARGRKVTPDDIAKTYTQAKLRAQ